VTLAVCCTSLLMSGMDVTIVNLGMPAIQADLHASLTDLQWVIDVYTVVVASLLILGGTTGDRFGRRRTFQIGLVVFSAASVLCARAPTLGWLLVYRGLQAVGASMLNPVAMSIITTVFVEPRARARAIGIWSGVFGLSLGLGPLVGGVLIGALGWRAIFWANSARSGRDRPHGRLRP
jgi:MFS family permease